MDATTAPPKTGPFFGHPIGLAYLSLTEGFVTFSYYGMQSLLVLYMTGQLLLPAHLGRVIGFSGFHHLLNGLYGHVEGQPLASAIMGVYSALIFATPILGGLVADRLLGRTRTIILGAVLMTIGHFLMAFDASFLIALACIIIGMGCAGSMRAQVGALYGPGDLRRADAFQLYLLAVQISVMAAPIICGTLGEDYAWHWGFAAAGAGMLLGLVAYLLGRKHLPPERPPGRADQAVDKTGTHETLSAHEWKTLLILIMLLPVLALAVLGNQEIFNAYLLWGKANYQLVFFGRNMPVSWLISLDAIVSAVTLTAVITFWRWWARRRREPDEIIKMAIGTVICAFAPLILAAASIEAAGGHKVGLFWGIGFHVVNDLGFANLYAVGMALYSRAAPPSLGATVVTGYSLHVFLANLLVGKLAGLLATMSPVRFWLMHSVLIAGAAGVMLLFALLFRHQLAPAIEAER